MHDYFVAQLQSRGELANESESWEKLRRIIVDQLGVQPEEVIRSAEFIRDLKVD